MIGIYIIKNILDNKIYVGQSVNIKTRWNKHKRLLKGNIHGNSHLQSAWNKYGEEKFVFEVLLECYREQLDYWEDYYIEIFRAWINEFGYNYRKCSDGSGYHSEETKKKIGDANRDPCDTTRERMRLACIGRRVWNKGIPRDEETKKKISNTRIAKGIKSWNEGKRYKCPKITEALKGSKQRKQYNIVCVYCNQSFMSSKEYTRACHDCVILIRDHKELRGPVETYKERLQKFNKKRENFREHIKGTLYYNNGITNKRVFPDEIENLGKEWVKGRLMRSPKDGYAKEL